MIIAGYSEVCPGYELSTGVYRYYQLVRVQQRTAHHNRVNRIRMGKKVKACKPGPQI
eukprot:gene12196-3591_t